MYCDTFLKLCICYVDIISKMIELISQDNIIPYPNYMNNTTIYYYYYLHNLVQIVYHHHHD
jgi:hypothetical protein